MEVLCVIYAPLVLLPYLQRSKKYFLFRTITILPVGAIPPPPPPNVMAHFPKDESDALSAMLMAWYMSGYHT
ncbi:unnamed protein product, partial [Nesidiocoris tenuis]